MSRGAGRLQVLKAFAGFGPVNLLQCFSRRDETQMTANHGRDGVGQIRREVLQCAMDDATKPSRCQAALPGRFVDGHDAANFERSCQFLVRGIRGAIRLPDDLELRLGELEFAAAVILFHLAIKRDDLARLELVPKISGVEPDTLQPRPALSGGHLKDGHAAGTEQARGPHFGNYGGHFAGTQFSYAPGIQPILVAKREVVQQVVESLNVLGRQHLGELWADAFDILNGGARLQHLKGC